MIVNVAAYNIMRSVAYGNIQELCLSLNIIFRFGMWLKVLFFSGVDSRDAHI